MLCFNLAVLLCEVRRATEAEALLPQLRALVTELGNDNDIDSIRLLWLEGKVASHLGRWQEAFHKLARVREEFVALGMGYDAALASLELAAVHLEVGNAGEVKAIAREVLPIFEAHQVEREILASLIVFCQAAEQEVATAAVVRRLVAQLARAPHVTPVVAKTRARRRSGGFSPGEQAGGGASM